MGIISYVTIFTFMATEGTQSKGASLGDFLLAPTCPIEKVTLWEGFLYLTSGSETEDSAMKDKFLPKLGIEPGAPSVKPSRLSTSLSHPPSTLEFV